MKEKEEKKKERIDRKELPAIQVDVGSAEKEVSNRVRSFVREDSQQNKRGRSNA